MNDFAAARPIEILLVDDDLGDALIATAALEDSKLLNHVRVVHDGDDGLAALRGTGRHRGAGRPDLVLLDLSLPRRDGREILAEIRADPELADIAVVVLTSSRDEADHLRARQLGATTYMTKPVDFARLIEIVRQIHDLHVTIVRAGPR